MYFVLLSLLFKCVNRLITSAGEEGEERAGFSAIDCS